MKAKLYTAILAAFVVLLMTGGASAYSGIPHANDVNTIVAELNATNDTIANSTGSPLYAANAYDGEPGFRWDYSSFDGIWLESLVITSGEQYNPDGDTLTYPDEREIGNGSLIYSTSPVFQEYELHANEADPDRTVQTDMEVQYNESLNQSIGLCVESDNPGSDCGYFIEGWLGEEYVAIDGNADKLCERLVEFEDDDTKTLAVGEEWNLGGRYTLTANQIDIESNKVWFSLKKDGTEIDSEVAGVNSTQQYRVCTYTADIGGEYDIPVFSCYVDNVSRETNTVQIKYVFLIDEDVFDIDTSDEYGIMEVMTVTSDRIILKNDEIPITLKAGGEDRIMGNLYFVTEGGDTALNFYPTICKECDGDNRPPDVLVVSPSGINTPCIAGDNVNISAIVRDEDGVDDIANVTMNFSEYGVDIVEMELVGEIDDIRAMYNCSVVIGEFGEIDDGAGGLTGGVCGEVTVTDASGDYGDMDVCFAVVPGECAYMELENRVCEYSGIEGEDLRTVALTQLSYCNVKDHAKWWKMSEGKFDLYMLRYVVDVYDEYGNFIDNIEDCECCNGFTATTTGEDASLKFCDNGRITLVNENSPGKTTLNVNCNGSDIPSISQEVEFLNPVAGLNVTADVDVIYESDFYEGEYVNISATITDVLGNPILMPRVDVDLYVDGNETMTMATDANGTVEFVDVDVSGCDAGDEIVFRAEAECKQGLLTMNVSESVLGYVEIGAPEYMVCGDNATMTYTCKNPNGNAMTCPECVPVWSCDELGEINNSTGNYTAGDAEGIATVNVNVSGVNGTADIVIDGHELCVMITPETEQNITSGTVMLSWNATYFVEVGEDGTMCLQALGNPIPEWSNDTKGAIVSVDSYTESDNATLNMSGDGDIWMLNDTTGNWSFYAEGDTAVVNHGLNQTFALVTEDVVEPEPDPDPTPTPTSTYTHRGGGGGGSGGTYPPGWDNHGTTSVATHKPTAAEPSSKPAPKQVSDNEDDVEDDDGVNDDVDGSSDSVSHDDKDDDETPAPATPGFTGVFVILGVLAVAYLIGRKRA